jgi:hypothetical protein
MPTVPEHALDRPRTTYEPPGLSAEAAFFGHYVPSRARVQLLLDYALAHQHEAFWRALARRLTSPGCALPWNEAIAAAADAGIDWDADARVRRIVHAALYEGRIAGRSRAPAVD